MIISYCAPWGGLLNLRGACQAPLARIYNDEDPEHYNPVGDDSDRKGCKAVGVDPGDPNNPATIHGGNNPPDPNNPDVEGNTTTAKEGSWLDYLVATTFHQIPQDYSNDVPLNPFAQQLFKELGKRIDAYPAVCDVGVTATMSLPKSRVALGFDLNSSKGARYAERVRVATLGPVQGSFSVKGGQRPGTSQ